MKLVLLRHGESEWNLSNRFTGWTDVDLSKNGKQEAKQAGRAMKKEGLDFDVCYTSYLKRAIHTLNLALAQMDRDWLPVQKTWKLNERHYGALQGLNKAETAARYGEEQVHTWRRSYDVRPPELTPDDERAPARQPAYRGVDAAELPLAESLKDTIARTLPYFEQTILPGMKKGERALIVAHGNSLRALMMSLENMSPEEISGVDLPTGIPLVYELDENGVVLSKTFLGDPETVQKKMRKVAAQGKAVH